MNRQELTNKECEEIWIKILKLVQEGDPLFTCIDDTIISGLVEEGLIFIDPSNANNMNGTILTDKGIKELRYSQKDN